jgi:hypothetical protein
MNYKFIWRKTSVRWNAPGDRKNSRNRNIVDFWDDGKAKSPVNAGLLSQIE